MADKETTQNYLMGFVVGGSAVLVGCVVIWAGLYLFLKVGTDSINLPVIIITGVVFLLTVLGLLTYSFSALGLANRDEALGLPSGSVRAVIAIMLLVIFAIVSIYVFSVVFTKDPKEGIDLGKQLITLIGTLVTAVASFYFGSSSIAAVTKPPAASGGPDAKAVTPRELQQGTVGQKLTITGSNLRNVVGVELTFDDQPKIVGEEVSASDTSVTCKVTTKADSKAGPWTVVVADNANNKSEIPNNVRIVPKTDAAPAAEQSGSPEITSVDANALQATGAERPVKISGKNLTDIETVNVAPDNGITIGTITQGSGDEITVNVTIRDATPAKRNVSVVNKAGVESKPVEVELKA